MTESRLLNKFLINKTAKLYIKSKGINVSVFFERKKKNFFENVDNKNITDNKIFWKTVKPFLANKSWSNRTKITFTQKDETISRSKDVAEIFNTVFANVLSNLGIVINESILGNAGETNDSTVNITERYKTHPSIRLIKKHAT